MQPTNSQNAPAPHTQAVALLQGNHSDPFGYLGIHRNESDTGFVVRACRPDAAAIDLIVLDEDGSEKLRAPMERIHEGGVFAHSFEWEGETKPRYSFEIDFGTSKWTTADPYSFDLIIGEQDCYFWGEGTHYDAYKTLGAHPRTIDGIEGTAFAVWAPNARRVSVVGDFNRWDGRTHIMRKRIEAGVWELFIPGVTEGDHYKFEVVGDHGELTLKTDPFALRTQWGQKTAALVHSLDHYTWNDQEWMERRASADPYHSAMSVYEVHLGSWARVTEDGNRWLTYRELADQLLDHVEKLNFTHIELMPITEFPFDGSWGYQVTGYFSPTSRYGDPDDFRYLVDQAHQRGIGVILDWVPAHFPKDDHGLGRFDGTALFEHADPRQGEHKDWGTYIFNFDRNEVRNFLIASALLWMREYHIDGLRVDAVASMLYLDYSREAHEWVPNKHGGRENLGAIQFMRQLNEAVYGSCPGAMVIAEESTAWGGVSRPTSAGGLGFGFKWNMGWMNDTLTYMEREPVHRQYHHGEATFSMVYAYDENFMLVLSHDEVVHGKGSLINKMPGDRWQKFANLRMLYGWMWAHPGKKLIFMGDEIAQWDEWNYHRSIDWHLRIGAEHSGMERLVSDLNAVYRDIPALNDLDHEPGGFSWLDHDDAASSTFTFFRRSRDGDVVLVAVNATPVARHGYRIGAPTAGTYHEIINTDADIYAGSNVTNQGDRHTEQIGWQHQAQSLVIDIPPLGVTMLRLKR
ncbi:1,4-alpha-glucan branching protein GlgB [Sulfuriroseicoccus oceanibius]|uniref:1,4-alpha-glucan branching enzyme GlgB n=1 Tax=Sulfuriroseicoccus oceanibius TaxID=2707525 RepID=A0A6B3LEZ7_9BACT|nr:1,4-alpha-glucan branching protein GlgB [Sulfuriroseicoccus oceanibius]QQL45069.1 1,4-alpha-glucan branching protein GlgB [Sulfuriroseicoccus oceanibius]